MNEPFILGINASHNGGCCLLRGATILVAVQEERLTRRKRQRITGSDPALSIAYCLEAAGITSADLARVVVCVQKSATEPYNDAYLNPVLRLKHNRVQFDVISHHLGHAVGTFVTSGFEESTVLVADGVGSYWSDLSEAERNATILGTAQGQETISVYSADTSGVRALEKHLAPPDQWLSRSAWLYDMCPSMPRFHSLGGMYSSVATQIFGDMDEAGKVMGLAPYGSPVHSPGAFYTIGNDGAFSFSDELAMQFQTTDRWPRRKRAYENLAASVQVALEGALLSLLKRVRGLSPSPRLCLAGGLALNSVANQRIIAESSFSDVHIIPAADDSGTAIGAAFYGLWRIEGRMPCSKLPSDGLGRYYSTDEIREAAQRTPAIICESESTIIDKSAELLAAGQIVGWFQGGAEFGPRALGHRSILCDARRLDAKDEVNHKIKHREGFRPFAPAILSEHVNDWFDLQGTPVDSPFMLRVARWHDHAAATVPAVVHVDGTGRFQTVTEANGRLFHLLRAFYRITKVPILLNTSFNIMGEPIVETPDDALWALLFTDLDCCIIQDCVIRRTADFVSIADLYPRLADTVLALTLLPRHSHSQAKRDDLVARIRVRRRWGETDTPVTLIELLTMRAIAHQTRIGDLCAFLRHDYPELDITDQGVLFTIGALKRAAVLEVADHPTDAKIAFAALSHGLANI